MIKCKTCDEGNLLQCKRYRMSKVVVFIGYIFLIPSFLGMLFGGMFLISSMSSSLDETSGIVAGGFAIFILITSLVGGLLGWLLVMKKKVLQCNFCGAIIPIS